MTDTRSRPESTDATEQVSPGLTERQLQILRWLDENPSNRAAWTVNGRPVRARDKSENWSHMEVSGPNGSILIALADNKALHQYIIGCPTRDKVYGPSELGKAAIAKARGVSQ